MPLEWSGFEATRNFRGVRYEISVKAKVLKTKSSLAVDGAPIEGQHPIAYCRNQYSEGQGCHSIMKRRFPVLFITLAWFLSACGSGQVERGNSYPFPHPRATHVHRAGGDIIVEAN